MGTLSVAARFGGEGAHNVPMLTPLLSVATLFDGTYPFCFSRLQEPNMGTLSVTALQGWEGIWRAGVGGLEIRTYSIYGLFRISLE